ncbi:MAG: hypothetical protein ACRCTD_06500 [Beijerinckiaceae bacterium]
MRRCYFLLAVVISASTARAEGSYGAWPVIDGPFPSTGGGGVMIEGYAPKIAGATCVTAFAARLPDGQRFHNTVEFEATAIDGGTLCRNGKWTSADGSASGTTPLQVFIKDGVARRSP